MASMLADILKAASAVSDVEDFAVVTADDEAIVLAEEVGAEAIREPDSIGLNEGARRAIQWAQSHEIRRLLLIPSDIPLVTAEDLAGIFQEKEASVVIAPARDGGGTNALMLHPPNILLPQYGKESFQRHLQLARSRGLSSRVVQNARIALDIDTRDDLRVLCARYPRGKTAQFLREYRLSERLALPV